MTPNDELFRFGPFELDPRTEELRRSGTVLRLPPQPFRILLLLVRRAGETVTREEIQQEVWKDETFVDFEHGINSAIRQIRFVLNDTAEAPRYVRTLPRRGYVFVATVESTVASVSPPSDVERASARRPSFKPRTLWGLAAALLVVIATVAAFVLVRRDTPAARVVAVKPFRWIGASQPGLDTGTFAEELSARLATLPRERIQLVESGRADVLIDGSVRRVEGRVRVIVSGIDGKTRAQLWSETIERPAERNDGIAVEVAHRTIAELARRYLPPTRHEPLLRSKVSPAALQSYRLARQERGLAKGYDIARIRSRYEEAIRLEPRFAEAWSGLAELHGEGSLSGPLVHRDRAAAEALRCARRAVELQPNNAEALSILGIFAAQRDYDLVKGEELLRRATLADPGYFDAQVSLASALTMLGRGEEALRAYETARQLDPASLDLSPQHPLLYLYARRYDDARARYREILAVSPGARVPAWGVLTTYVAQQQWAEALQAMRILSGPEVVEGLPPTADGVHTALRRIEPVIQSNYSRGIFNEYLVAVYYALAGDHDRAFAMLDRAVDARLPVVSYLRVDPRLDSLRNDPRFDTLLVRAKLGPPESLVAGR